MQHGVPAIPCLIFHIGQGLCSYRRPWRCAANRVHLSIRWLKKYSSKLYLPPGYLKVPAGKETEACPAERSGAWQDEVERNNGAFER